MNPGAWRSLTNDPSVVRKRVTPGTTRRIVGYARPYARQIAAFLVLVVVTSALTVATPLLFKDIIDAGVIAGDTSVVVLLSSVVAVIAFVEAGLALAQRYFSARLGEGLIYDLRSEVYDHVQRMPLAFFTRSQTGALVSRLNNDVIGAQRAFTSTLSGVVSNVISLALVVGAMILLSWKITVVAFLLVPIFLFPARWAGRRLAGLSREQMEVNADLGGTMTERFQVGGAMTVKLFGRPDEEHRGFQEQAAHVRDLGVKIAMSSRIFFSAMTLVAALATALVYGIGGLMSINGTLTVGTLLALAALMGRLYGPLTALTNVHVDIMTALVSFERVFEVLDLPLTIRDADNAIDLPAGAPARVELDQVRFSYDSAEDSSLASLEGVARSGGAPSGEVLHDVSFTIEPGQLVALVGQSGAGKSTVGSLLARLYDVDSGAVLIGERDVRQLRQASLRDTIGYVAQDPFMFHDTIRANLSYAAPDATGEQMRSALADAQILDLVETLPDGLDTVIGDRGHRLSGGERQRLAIARLMLKEPRIVVLDEATAHLDSGSERAVQAALDTALEGRTSLVIAHRLSTVRNADAIVVLDEGNVVEHGTHDELIARDGTYAELYRTQFATDAVAAAG